MTSPAPLFTTRQAEHPAEMPADLADRYFPHPVGETMVTESCIACGQTWGIPGSEQRGVKGLASWQTLRDHLAQCRGGGQR